MTSFDDFLTRLRKTLYKLEEIRVQHGINPSTRLLFQIDDYREAIRLTEAARANGTLIDELQHALNGLDLELHTHVQFEPMRKPFDGRNPYRGLEKFTENDHEFFFGRARAIADLHTMIHAMLDVPVSAANPALLTVIGASGSGKSSLVRAGLLPTLKADTASAPWIMRVMVPGAQPVDALADLLMPLLKQNLRDILEELRRDEKGLHYLLRQLLAERDEAVYCCVVIDQFEEIFTLCTNEQERRAFIDMLTFAATQAHARNLFMITMRADFYQHAAQYQQLAQLLPVHQLLVAPLTRLELREAILLPAERVGLDLEKEVALALIQDAGNEPGALPLLQHALLELFNRRSADHTLTLKAYQDIEGVHGALARRANAIFDGFSELEQQIARNIFLRLTTSGEDASDIRRRIRRTEAYPLGIDAELVDTVLYKLADKNARLIVLDETSVEITHEILIQHWDTLRGWLDADRTYLRIHRQITEAAAEWAAHSQHDDYLSVGVRLAEIRAWMRHGSASLTAQEHAFVDASIAVDRRELDRTRATARSLLNRLVLAVVFGIVTVAAALAACIFAFMAQRNATEMMRRNDIIQAQLLGSTARAQEDDELGLLLALTAYEMLPENSNAATGAIATGAIYEALNDIPFRENFNHSFALKYGPSDVLFHPKKQILGIAAIDGVYVWNLDQPKQGPHEIADGNANILSFDGAGAQMAAGFDDGAIKIWQMDQLDQAPVVLTGLKQIKALALSPDGRHVAAAESQNSNVWLWDLNAPGARPTKLAPPKRTGDTSYFSVQAILALDFSPDGQTLAIAAEKSSGLSGSAWLQPINTSQPPQIILGDRLYDTAYGSLTSLDFSPDGGILVAGTRENALLIWDLAKPTNKPAFFQAFDEQILDIAFSPDGSKLVAGGSERSTYLVDFVHVTAEKLPSISTLAGNTMMVKSVSFGADNQTVSTGGMDDYVRVWHLGAPEQLSQVRSVVWDKHGSPINSVVFSPDNHTVAAGQDFGLFLRDTMATDGKQVAQPLYAAKAHAIVFSPDGEMMISAGIGIDSTIYVWDVAKIAQESYRPRALNVPGKYGIALAISADGSRVAALSDNGSVAVWDRFDLSRAPLILSQDLPLFYGALVFTPDGKTLMIGAQNTLLAWDLTNPNAAPQKHTINAAFITSLAMSDDGTKLAFSATGSNDMLGFWDLSSGNIFSPYLLVKGEISRVNAVAFHPDSHTLAAGRDDGTIMIWDTTRPNNSPTVLHGHTGRVTSLDYSRDGLRLVSGSDDQSIRVWPSLPGLIALGCDRVWRNLTKVEWYTYLPDKPYRETCAATR